MYLAINCNLGTLVRTQILDPKFPRETPFTDNAASVAG